MLSCVKLRNLFLTSLVCLLALTSLAQSQTRYSGGTGTAQSPYEIATAQDLIDLGNNTDDYDKHFIMTADIDLAGRVFDKAVIAGDIDADYYFDGTEFTGSFNGNGHTISNLSIANSSGYYIGLFGNLGSAAKVTNLKLTGVNNTGLNYVGGLCGYNTLGTISECEVSGFVTGSYCSAGISGYNSGTVSKCTVSGEISQGDDIGGICGFNEGTITECFGRATIKGGWHHAGGICSSNSPTGIITNCRAIGSVSGSLSVGGICGANQNIISDCYAQTTATGTSYVGGVCGYNLEGDISRCYAIGQVNGNNQVGGAVGLNRMGSVIDSYSQCAVTADKFDIGGFCGQNDRGAISGCFATGEVKGIGLSGTYGTSDCVGGLVGWNNNGTISSCYATGSVGKLGLNAASGTSPSYTGLTGGFCGANTAGAVINNSYAAGIVTGIGCIGCFAGSNESRINNCYAVGQINGTGLVGGFCGIQYNRSGTTVINNSFWDIQTSGLSTGCNFNSSKPGTVVNLSGKETADMKQILCYSAAGWDFTEADGSVAIWQMLGSNYPTLAWQLTTDLDGNGSVDLADFAILAANWLMPVSGAGMPDYDRSGMIDLPDFEVFLADWLYQEPSSLIGHWTLDETGGTIAADASEYNNPGTVTGSPAYSTGIKNGCYVFDGDDYIVSEGCPGVAGTLPRSVAAWIKADADLANNDQNLHCVVSWGNPVSGSMAKWFVSIDDVTGKLALGIYGARLVATGSNTLEDGQWHHIAVVLPVGATNINQVKMYIDGAEVTTNAGSLNAVMNTALSEVSIGANNTSTDPGIYIPAQLFKGSIDDVRIYNIALTTTEIAQMAQITIE